MTDKQNKLIPKLRFPEFKNDGEWEQKFVKDICSIETGKSNTQDQDVNGLYPFFIRSENSVKSSKYLYDCEAVITIGDGKIGQVFHYINGKFDLHQRCYKMSDFQGVDGKFFFYFFSSHFYERAMRMSAKATVDSVRLEMISDMPIYLPSLKEQKRIAEFLTSLDDLLTGTKSILEQLKVHKKGLMQKLFPASGRVLPEIRLNGFEHAGEWRVRKLKEIIIVNSGKDYKHLRRGEVPVYGTGGYMTSVDERLSDVDAVGIGRKGTIDKPIFLKAPFWTVDTLFFLTTSREVDIHFLFYLMLQIPWKKYAEQTGVPSLSKNSIDELEVCIPGIPEQLEIASIFHSCDNLINEYEEKMRLLCKYKQGLLQMLMC